MYKFKLDKKDIKSMFFEEIFEDMSKKFIESYRVCQVYDWITKGTASFDDMTNLPKALREELKLSYRFLGVRIKEKKVSLDSTVKYLFSLYDEEVIEAVIMKYKHGYSMCISTQAGCKMGCAFCSTGKGGFSRNLFPSEMISQIETAQRDLGIKISNVVFMGMGEPLDNYSNVIKFLKLITSPDHLNIGARHISLSTCGIVDKIYSLAREKLQITLSVSLHAPNDGIRSKIMKINNKWGVNELIASCKHYTQQTNRRISFEYVMIKDVNDSLDSANELGKLLQGMLCHVNLIPLNNSLSCEWQTSSPNDIYRFKNVLEKYKINATVRRTLGKDINGACGQLRYNRTQIGG